MGVGLGPTLFSPRFLPLSFASPAGYNGWMSLPYRLLFLDLDGTLIGHDDVISPRTLDTLHRAQQQGCILVICTGRSRHAAQHIAAQIGGEGGYGIASNGSVVFQWNHPRPIQKSTLSEPVTWEAIRLARAHGLAPLCLGLEDDDRVICADRSFPLPPSYMSVQGSRLLFCDDVLQEIAVRDALPMSIDVHGEDERDVARLTQVWRQAFGAGAAVYHCFVERFACWGAFLNPAETGKARAAQWVAEALGVPREQTLAIGDYLNDLDLLQWAGLGVCMGDGHADVRACAGHVTGTLAEDGVAQALERFVLRELGA